MGLSSPSVVIIGGGASGVLLAAHLLRDHSRATRVTLIERRREIGPGMAYSARHQEHVLNVAAPNMGAYADDPEHFWRWAVARGDIGPDDRFVFLPRRLYGAYLTDVLAEASVGGQLTLLREAALDLRTTGSGVEVTLTDGSAVFGDTVVLAVGHEENQARSKGIAVRVGSPADTPLDPEAPVMILGSGLSMIDAWLRLAEDRHSGPITIVSRHGLLPLAHRPADKLTIEAGAVPFGSDIHDFQCWFRQQVADARTRGHDWRSVVDALRPFNQRIWQSWSPNSKRRFLEHVRPFWNIHRHRMPPDLHRELEAAVAGGQVSLRAGKLADLARSDTGVTATVRERGARETSRIEVARVYDCGGVTVDVSGSSNPLIQALLRRGLGRPDPLRIGLDVTTHCEVVGADGSHSGRLLAIGPLTRGMFWEIEAIPDIRVQVAAVASSLAETVPA